MQVNYQCEVNRKNNTVEIGRVLDLPLHITKVTRQQSDITADPHLPWDCFGLHGN